MRERKPQAGELNPKNMTHIWRWRGAHGSSVTLVKDNYKLVGDFTQANKINHERVLLCLLFFIFYMTDAVFGYFNIYLKGIGFSTLQLGLLTSGASISAMIFLPLIGSKIDSVKNKNIAMIILLAISAILSVLLRFNKAFLYILLIYTLFMISRGPQRHICDSMALEHSSLTGSKFGYIRTMGCIGYSVMAIIAGKITDNNISAMFYLFAAVAGITAVINIGLPGYGHSDNAETKQKISFKVLLEYKELVCLVAFAVFFVSTKAFYQCYYSVYFTESIGGSAYMYGWLISIGALMEIPFTFFLDKILGRFGIKRIILICGLVEGLRWLLAFFIQSPLLQIATQLALASTNMLFTLSVTMHINNTVSPKHRITSLSTYAAITSLASILLGNFAGGAVGSIFGLRIIFLICGIVNFFACAGFAYAFFFKKQNV